MKRMIFHIPLKIDPNRHSASQIRPLKMLQAFRNLGYKVDIIMGFAKDRKPIINEIKNNIKNGIKYDFLYSESSTMPTLLTESHHFPTHPFLDFNFFQFCKDRGIKIGLFYRDIYWCFSEYDVSIKTKIAKIFYKYDIAQYNKLVDILFVPSFEMIKCLNRTIKPTLIELPAGADIDNKNFDNLNNSVKCNDNIIEILYVGGIGDHYDLSLFVKVLGDFHNMHLTLCCRKEDWENIKDQYIPLLSNNITIIHKSGMELDEYYKKADICNLFVRPDFYRSFVMPFKLFEYIGKGLPVLVSKETKSAQFIESHKCGISIKYDEMELRKALSSLSKRDLSFLKQNVIKLATSQSWEARARQVVSVLKM